MANTRVSKCRHGALGEGVFLLFRYSRRAALATLLAGLLTYGSDDAHTFPHLHAVVYVSVSPLTAAGTVPDLHRFPLGQRRKHIASISVVKLYSFVFITLRNV